MHVAALKAQPKPKEAKAGPVLDMVRHPDGEITWERHNHANGEITYLPRHARPAATAADYVRIFGKKD